MHVKSLLKFLTNPSYRFLYFAYKGKYDKMPDNEYLRRKFSAIMGYSLSLDDPKTLNEKLQWLKINDRNPKYTEMVDKYEAKEYVASVIGDEYVVENYGVWSQFEDIDIDVLPNQFVLKCTHDSGGLVICRNKASFDKNRAKEKIERCLQRNYYNYTREWPYKDVVPRILAEKYIETNDDQGLVDYKFFCFNSIPRFLYISKGLEDHSTAQISFYSMDGQELHFHRSDYRPYHNAKLPSNFDEMKMIAEKLAKEIGCAFVRIDLYSVQGKVYFSEITFSPCSGMIPFEPQSADLELGQLLELPIKKG